eukprot:361895-Chlamydomonas_euryale.AAC.5
MAPTIFTKKTNKGPAKKKAMTFTIDCSKPVEDKIMEVSNEGFVAETASFLECYQMSGAVKAGFAGTIALEG